MKCEFKQVVRGFSHSIQSAAIAAEVTGSITAQVVGSIQAADEALITACANTEEEALLLESLVKSTKFEDQRLAGNLATKALFKKWMSE